MYGPYYGEIKQFSGDYAPRGWAFCNGQLLLINDYQNLYYVLGTQFGGDGITTFGLPDLRGRVPIHYSDEYRFATHGGQEQVTLSEAHLPVHTHVAWASSVATPNNTGPENAFWGSISSAFTWGAGPGDQVMHPDTIKPVGEEQPHENRIPYVAISYIICLVGEIIPDEG